MRRSAWLGVALLLGSLIALGACGDDDNEPSGSASANGAGGESAEKDEHADHGSDEEAAFPIDEADITVRVDMKDFAFTGVPATVLGEKVLFEVTNDGPSEHELVVFEKGADEAVRGIEPLAKTKTQMLAVELKPGPFTVKCLVRLG